MKTKLFCLFLFVISISFAQIPTADLVKAYTFANGSLINEVTPGAGDLVAIGSASVLQADAINQTDNAIILNGDSFNGGTRTSGGNLTVSFWIKTATNDATVRSVVSQYGIGGFGPYGWRVQLVDGKIRLRSKSTNGGTGFAEVVLESSVIADNKWHHVLFTATNQQNPGFVSFGFNSRLYIDNELEISGVDYTSGSHSILNNPSAVNNAYIHNVVIADTNDKFLEGFDNLRIYNRALNTSEIKELYKDYFQQLPNLHVNPNATGSGFGDSWSNAITDLQKALDVADDQRVWVASGTYKPDPTDRTKTFSIREGVKFYGGFAGTETVIDQRNIANNPTILSGDLNDDDTNLLYNEPTRLENTHRVVSISGDNTLIDGFTIKSGHSNTGSYKKGAGIYKHAAVNTLEIKNCIIKDNVADLDGAIYAEFNALGTDKTALIENCKIQNNLSRLYTAFHIGVISPGAGSTIVNALVVNCLIENNFAVDTNANAGYAASAGGFTAPSFAGKRVYAKMVNCTVTNNTDSGTQPSLVDPAVIAAAGNVDFELYNSIVWNNSVPQTFSRNLTSSAYLPCQNTIILKNNITVDDLSTICSGATLSGNQNIDPLFTNTTNDFTLQMSSPAIDSGDNALNTTTQDLVLGNRVYNGSIDLGAYESTFGPNNVSLTVNIIGNGTVNQSTGPVAFGTVLNLTATPAAGSVFEGWTGDVIDANSVVSITMDSNKTVTASFSSPMYVNASASGNNDGSSWADAYVSLQDALTNAVVGEKIWIANGVYKPSVSSRNTYFVIDKDDVKIYGGFTGSEINLGDRVLGMTPTILSGDLNGDDVNVDGYINNYSNTTRNADNSYHIINITANNTVLDGLTISDAHNNLNTTERGGAIVKEKTVANLTLRNCIVKDNLSRNDNAGLIAEYQLNNSGGTPGELIVENCEFTNNMSRWASGLYSFVRTSTDVNMKVINTLFSENIAGDLNTGAARGISGSSAWLRNISGNNTSHVSIDIVNCTFVNNLDTGTQQSLNNNTRTTLALSQGSVNTTPTNATVANCIFWGNQGTGSTTTRAITDQYTFPLTSLTVVNSIDELNFNDGSITSRTNTNNANPLFVDVANGDYHLIGTSPGIDAGDNSYVTLATDLDNKGRILGGTVDLGVYEYDATLSVEDVQLSKNKFKIYPNPTSGIINIQTNNTVETVEVYNLIGKKVLQVNSKTINVSNLSQGVYILKITSENGVLTTKRFIKQ